MAWISIYDAAAKMCDELIDAQRRIDAGEPFNTTAADLGLTPGELRELIDAQRRIDADEPFDTTAADLGLTPGELRELFEAQQTQQRENAYKQKWQTIYDNDEQDLF